MIQVLIADDEIYFRNYMLTAVDWSSLGFQICCVAGNGQEVLSAIDETPPDVAFLDINMPLLDGISLAERLKELRPELMIVFVTGYSDFSYAKKAIQLHIEDYLLKPFSPEELTKLLITLKQKVKLQRSQISKDQKQQQIIMKQFLCSLLSFAEEESWGGSQQQLISSEWKVSDYFVVCVIELSYLNCVEFSKEHLPLWKFSVMNCVDEVLPETEKYYAFEGPNNRLIYLFNFRSSNGHELYPYNKISKAVKFVHDFFPITLSVGIGNLVIGEENISSSYTNALLALQHQEFDDRVIHYFAPGMQNLSKGFYSLDIYNRLMFALRQSDLTEVSAILQDVEEKIKTNRYDADSIQTMFTSIFSICLSFISEKNGNIMEVLENDLSWYQNCFAAARIHDSCLFLLRIYEKTMKLYGNSQSSRAMEIIKLVQDYVRENYMDEELTVESISTHIMLDSSYIRKLFNKYMKCTITDFLVTTRMEQARKYMEQGETNITQLSAKVGYKDSGYFSKVFKKYYGTTPKGYIKEITFDQ